MMNSRLETATKKKLQKYKDLLSNKGDLKSFWNIVVITACDDEQKSIYEQQLELKKARNELPRIRYLVYSDPCGAKIGCGGATMHVIEQLEQSVPKSELEQAKVLLVHAGGFSQRLPNLSVLGKIFMALPCGDPIMDMFDALLVMYIDLPERMNPGVFLAASDVIFLYDGTGEWDFTAPGFTAIAHPAPVDIGTTHGVFLLDDSQSVWDKFQQDPSSPAHMGTVRRFLHKYTAEKLKNSGAVIPGTDQVYVDLAYYFDFKSAWKFSKFYSDNKPLTCEIDSFGDFLQALGPDATKDYCKNTANVTTVTNDLIEMREKVFDLLKETPFRVVIFNEAQFNHLGTGKEYIYHLCLNKTLMKSFEFKTEVMVKEEHAGASGDHITRELSCCVIMLSVIQSRESLSIGKDSVIEYCILGERVNIGSNCIISNLHVPACSEIPDNSFLHTVAVEIGGKTQYTTLVFGVGDNVKAKKPAGQTDSLNFCGVSMGTAISQLGYTHMVWNSEHNESCNLWTAKLFPVFATRKQSSLFAVNVIRKVKGLSPTSEEALPEVQTYLSASEIMKAKSVNALLMYHSELRKVIRPTDTQAK